MIWKVEIVACFVLSWNSYGETEESHQKRRIVGNPAEISTGYLSNTSKEHYHYTSPLKVIHIVNILRVLKI